MLLFSFFQGERALSEKTVLNVGCGQEPIPFFLKAHREVRLDLNPAFKPDIVADMTNLPEDIGPFDMVYAAHTLEHVAALKVDQCLAGWHRVLKPGGAVIIFVPDLEGVQADNKPLYHVGDLPICGFDLIYGCRYNMAVHEYFEHRCGFISQTMREALERAGFVDIAVHRVSDPFPYNLFGFGRKGTSDG
jgi:SAM-dependent methyltransferase